MLDEDDAKKKQVRHKHPQAMSSLHVYTLLLEGKLQQQVSCCYSFGGMAPTNHGRPYSAYRVVLSIYVQEYPLFLLRRVWRESPSFENWDRGWMRYLIRDRLIHKPGAEYNWQMQQCAAKADGVGVGITPYCCCCRTCQVIHALLYMLPGGMGLYSSRLLHREDFLLCAQAGQPTYTHLFPMQH